MTLPAVLVLFLIAHLAPAAAQPGTEYVGKLKSELTPSRSPTTPRTLRACTDDERAKLPVKLGPGDNAFSGTLNWSGTKADGSVRGPMDGVPVVLVEPAAGAAFVYVDVNGDGVLARAERFVFSDTANAEPTRKETVVPIDERQGVYHKYRIVLFFDRARSRDADTKPQIRHIYQSYNVFAEALVRIGGRATLVQFDVSPPKGVIDPREGRLGIDGDGDGKVDPSSTSVENALATDEEIVFRVGDRYVSVKQVDQKKGTVTLVEHPASDYRRIEMRVGAQVPDFEFVDFSGAARKLSDFRGKYVLLDFWGTWCGPCVAEIPYLKAAYEAFRDRSFEIIGIDGELPDKTEEDLAKGLDKARAFVGERGVTWPQATPASIRDLHARRFRVTAWPTTLLLDPRGTIVSIGGKDAPLRGDSLKATLDSILPPRR